MPNANYAFISAYLKSAEARVLAREHIERLVRVPGTQNVAASLREVLEAVRDTEAGRYLDEAMLKTFDDADRHLWRYLGDCLRQLMELKLMPDELKRLLRAYMVKYDVVNLKAVLEALASGKPVSLVPVGWLGFQGLLDRLSGADGLAGVIEVLVAGGLADYADILRAHSGDDARSRFIAGASLDRRYYEDLLATARNLPDEWLVAKTFSIMIDMANLSLVARALALGIGAAAGDFIIGGGYLISDKLARDLLGQKLADLPGALAGTMYHDIAEEIVAGYNRAKDVSVVNAVSDEHRFRLLREMLSPRVFSPLVLVWYITLKEVEVRNLRLALKATFDAVPLADIREYLVSV